MNMHDNINLLNLLAPAARAASANGSGVDIKDYVGKLKVVLSTPAGTGTTPTLDVAIEDSADNASFAALSPAIAFTQVTDAAASVQAVGLNTELCRRYIRVAVVIAGGTPSFTVGVIGIGQKQVY